MWQKWINIFFRVVAKIWRPPSESKPDTSWPSFRSTRLEKSGNGEKNFELENIGGAGYRQIRLRSVFQKPETSDSVGTGNAVDDPDAVVGSGRPDPSSVDGNLRPVEVAKGFAIFLRGVRLPPVGRRRRHGGRHLRLEAEQNYQRVERHQVRTIADDFRWRHSGSWSLPRPEIILVFLYFISKHCLQTLRVRLRGYYVPLKFEQIFVCILLRGYVLERVARVVELM